MLSLAPSLGELANERTIEQSSEQANVLALGAAQLSSARLDVEDYNKKFRHYFNISRLENETAK